MRMWAVGMTLLLDLLSTKMTSSPQLNASQGTRASISCGAGRSCRLWHPQHRPLSRVTALTLQTARKHGDLGQHAVGFAGQSRSSRDRVWALLSSPLASGVPISSPAPYLFISAPFLLKSNQNSYCFDDTSWVPVSPWCAVVLVRVGRTPTLAASPVSRRCWARPA